MPQENVCKARLWQAMAQLETGEFLRVKWINTALAAKIIDVVLLKENGCIKQGCRYSKNK